MRTVIGLDPSLASSGVAVVSPGGGVQLHRLRTKGRKGAPWKDRYVRLCDIVKRFGDVLDGAGDMPVIVMEGPAYSAQSTSQHDRAGLWWLMYREAVGRGARVIVAAPTVRCKYATGRGNAGKDEVLAAVVRRYPDVDVSGNDVADALVFAAIGRRLLGAPLEESLPKSNLSALKTLSTD